MPQVKRRSKLKRREAALVLGAAGVSLAMAGGWHQQPRRQRTYRRRTTHAELFSVRKKSPTSSWRPSTSTTKKTIRRFAKA